jgi:hypothetical protein
MHGFQTNKDYLFGMFSKRIAERDKKMKSLRQAKCFSEETFKKYEITEKLKYKNTKILKKKKQIDKKNEQMKL